MTEPTPLEPPALTPAQQALLAFYADLDHLSSLGLIAEHQRLTVSGQRLHAILEAGDDAALAASVALVVARMNARGDK